MRDIFEMACDLVNPDGGELNENQENEAQALVDFAKSCNAAMQARNETLAEYPERLQKAITELEAMAASPAFTEKARILAKIEGVKLALGYFEEMTR